MIIKRQYELLSVLIERDLATNEVFSRITKNLDKRTVDYIKTSFFTLNEAGMGCGLPGEMFAQLLTEVNALDETDPYDNGLTYGNVTKVDYEANRHGKAVRIIMKSKIYDLPERIVKVVAIDDAGRRIKDWGFRKPIT